MDHEHPGHDGPGYATPQAAIEESEPEEIAYVMGLYVGTDVDAPDFLAVVDIDSDSASYTEIIDRVEMPNRGDELHHFGWNACSSSCQYGWIRATPSRRAKRSSRIHIIDTQDRRNPEIEKVIDIESREHEGWDFPVPGLVTDLLVSMDDRYFFFSDWLHGDVRMYDISDPTNPRLADRIWAGGYFCELAPVQDRQFAGDPQMLQLSLDGERLYWTTSLFSSWDNQFFPEEKENGSVMLKADVNLRTGTI